MWLLKQERPGLQKALCGLYTTTQVSLHFHPGLVFNSNWLRVLWNPMETYSIHFDAFFSANFSEKKNTDNITLSL